MCSCEHDTVSGSKIVGWDVGKALFNPKTSILIQKCDPYTGNLNSEMSGDSKNAFQHCGDRLAHTKSVVCMGLMIYTGPTRAIYDSCL